MAQPMKTCSIIHFTRTAYKIAKKTLPLYSNKKSPHKYTQPQLFAILALCRFLDMDYRGNCAASFGVASSLRKYLGLKCNTPLLYNSACQRRVPKKLFIHSLIP
jgi:hypothetical protein